MKVVLSRLGCPVKCGRFALLVVAVLVATVACGGDKVEPSISLADAQATASKDLREAAAAVFPPGFSLEEMPPQPLPCTGSSNRPDGRVLVGVSFWVNGIDNARNNSYFDALKNWWTAHGWAVATDSRPGDMFVNAGRDGYLMSLQASVNGRLSLGNSTPCVWRSGTPEPSS